MNRRCLKKKIWICADVWMDIFPSFDHAQLGLKMALLSDRFDCLVDAHFDGKSELTIWRTIEIEKDEEPKPRLSVWIDDSKNYVDFPMPDHPLPTKIWFKSLWINYLDHSVIAFLRANNQIWDKKGINLEFSSGKSEKGVQQFWNALVCEIWPVFATSIRQLYFPSADHLDNLRRRISPTILTDLDQLISIDTDDIFLDVIADDGPNATAGQALAKWVHTPSKNGQPKRFFSEDLEKEGDNANWVNSFKEAFARATTSVSYKILFAVRKTSSIEPFESVNERTKEKLTLDNVPIPAVYWLLKRRPISEKAVSVQWENDEFWDDNLNKVIINLWANIKKSIGPLSPPAEEEKEKADESNEK